MKAKVTLPTRGKSNPPLKDLPPSKLLEEQTKRMEQQLKELKDVMAQRAQGVKEGEGNRWQSANTAMPIKNYAKNVLENKAKALNSTTGGKTIVVKPSREKASREKLPSREKLAPISGNTMTNTAVVISHQNKENELKKDFFKDALASTPQNSGINLNKTPTQQHSKLPSLSESNMLENNLKKALSAQKETNEVEKFLNDIGLPQYSQAFLDNGFDDLETMLEVQTKHLVEMKIPAGHQIKISKRLETLRQSNPDAQKTVPTPKSVATKSNEINIEHIKNNSQSFYGQSKNEYIQLAEPSKDQGIGDDKKMSGGLSDGQFNEAESHASFLEALNEWRNGNKAKPVEVERKKEPRAKESRSKKVRFDVGVKEEEPEDKEDDVDYISSKPKKSAAPKEEAKPFFFGSGGSSWNPVESGAKDGATDMSPRESQAHPKPKLSCWNCFKLVQETEAKSFNQKNFCSNDCIGAYKEMNSTKCMKNGCGKGFLKEEGIMKEGRWYCSEGHTPTKEELLLEEQRLMKQLAKESEINQGKEEVQTNSQNDEENDNNVDVEPIEFDLNVDLSNKKEVLTLAELEEKYKNLNQAAEKAQGAENEFEDSLA